MVRSDDSEGCERPATGSNHCQGSISDLQSDVLEIIEVVTKYCNLAKWITDDIVSEANLAITEAKKHKKNHIWVIDRVKMFAERSINLSRREISQPKIESGYLPKPINEKKITLKQKRKSLRDRAIRLSRKDGMTIPELVIVFGLKISRIKEIIKM